MPHMLCPRQEAWSARDRQQPLALRVAHRPHPVARTLQALDGVVFTALAILDAAQHGIQRVELSLTHVYITETRGGKGLEWLSGFHQPLQDRVRVDLTHPGRWRGDCPAPAPLDSHNPYGDSNASRCQAHGGVGGSAASERVASDAALSDGSRRVHPRHNEV